MVRLKKLFSFLIILFIYIAPLVSSHLRFQSDKDVQNKYKASFDSAEAFLKDGEYQDAIGKFQEALDLAENQGNEEGRILCYMRLGLLYWNIGELKESTNLYTQAFSFAERFEVRKYEEECRKSLDIYQLYTAGKEYRSAGNFDKSIESFEKAIELGKEIKSEAHEVKCLRQLSINFLETSDLKRFLSCSVLALELARRLNHRKEESQCLNNIGIYHWERDEYSKALSLYIDSLRIAQNTNNLFMESACLNNIGLLYRINGDYGKAIDYFMRALKIDRCIGNKRAISIDLNNIGVAYTKRAILYKIEKDFYEAKVFFEDCIKLAEEVGNNRVEIGVLNNLGFVYLNLKEYSESLRYLSSALEKAKKIKDLEAIGIIDCNLGNYNLLKRNIKKAESFFNKAEEISKTIKATHILWEAYFGLGQCREALNKYDSAIDYYEKSIKEIDSVRSQIVLDTFKAGFARDKLQVYEYLINLLYRGGKYSSLKNINERIFNIVEKAKARAFLEVLGESQLAINEKVSTESKKEEKKTLDKISSIFHLLSDAKLPQEKRKKIQEEYNQAENEYLLLLSKMRSEIHEVADMILPEPCHLAQVQSQLLDEKTAVVEYFLGEKQSYLIIIEKNNSFLYLLPSRGEIIKSIKGFIKELSDPPRRIYKGSLASNRLFKELLLPIEEVLPESIEHLIIVPDGFLYFLPFEALLTNSENKFVVEKFTVSYAPSCSSLLFLKEKEVRIEHPKSLLAIGNPNHDLKRISNSEHSTSSIILKEIYNTQGYDFSPIPYSRKEIKNIAKLFPKQKRDIYLGDQATEEVIKRTSLENYKIIHFACHSLLDEKFPFRSALVLAIDNNSDEDGFLQVREIYNLRLSADMIVLSACQTGKGRLENVEGVLGLPRIFFYCGARSVVSSLWKINDKSTTQFMSNFYKYISEGKSKSQALRLAKIKMINSKYSHPFFWASFVLYGDSSPLQGLN
jgi:CHAT domain-containing protein/Tfp pilus assembly protein PilF